MDERLKNHRVKITSKKSSRVDSIRGAGAGGVREGAGMKGQSEAELLQVYNLAPQAVEQKQHLRLGERIHSQGDGNYSSDCE